jgi:hypothetical protein
MKLKVGDTAPDPVADLNTDVSGATVLFRLMKLNGAFVFSRAATIDNAVNGIVRYTWQAGDTNTAGAYLGEFVVTYAGGDVQRFPQGSYLEVLIRPAVPASAP